jgi:hypothetical protein
MAGIALGRARLEKMIAHPQARGISDIPGGEPRERGKNLDVRKFKQVGNLSQ